MNEAYLPIRASGSLEGSKLRKLSYVPKEPFSLHYTEEDINRDFPVQAAQYASRLQVSLRTAHPAGKTKFIQAMDSKT